MVDLGGSLRQLVGLGQPQPFDPCLQDQWVAWDEWSACRQQQQQDQSGEEEGWLAAAPRHWASDDAKAAAVLIELQRAEERPLGWAVHNLIENVPVAWPVVVAAGDEGIAAAVERLFEEEVEAGKVVVQRLAPDEEHGSEEGKVCMWVWVLGGMGMGSGDDGGGWGFDWH